MVATTLPLQWPEQMLSLGIYPDVTLKEARQRRDEIRRQLTAGIDPSAARKAEQASAQGADSFETLAREWFGKFSAGWSESYVTKISAHLDKDLLPWLGSRPVRVHPCAGTADRHPPD